MSDTNATSQKQSSVEAFFGGFTKSLETLTPALKSALEVRDSLMAGKLAKAKAKDEERMALRKIESDRQMALQSLRLENDLAIEKLKQQRYIAKAAADDARALREEQNAERRSEQTSSLLAGLLSLILK